MSIKVYLADLTHTGRGIATEAFPLNIGLLKSHALTKFKNNEFQIELFKYPEDIIEAIKNDPPDIVGCSNYSWNFFLGQKVFRLVKELNPNCLTIMGGTNYPFTKDKQKEFLLSIQDTVDLNVFYEGEIAFGLILEKYLEVGRDGIFNHVIDSVHYIKNGELIAGKQIERIKELDSIPSPYATGILDKFFDGKLTPLVETARGCPFRCNFCNAGDSYFTNVNKFSDDYVKEEFTYIAQKASEKKIGHMTLADNNFGMIPRDSKTTQLVSDLKKEYEWPETMTAWTGKNSKKRVIEATKELGNTLSISMSVQALDTDVMKNIDRDNIRIQDFNEIAQELNNQGRPQHAELIVPLPGEDWNSHVASISKLMDTNVRSIQVHTLQILWGTPYKDSDEFKEKWGYTVPKYRIVPMDFGKYDGEYVFDIETVAVNTNSMSFQEYLDTRKLILFVELAYNGGVFELIRKYLQSIDVKISDWVMNLFYNAADLAPEIQEIINSFLNETQNELWDSNEAILEYYSTPENYEKLVSGEAGGNVLYKHKSLIWANASEKLIDFVFDKTTQFLDEKGYKLDELNALKVFTSSVVKDSYSFEFDELYFDRELSVDIPSWIEDNCTKDLSEYRLEKPINVRFEFQDNQIKFKEDGKRRYGDGFQGMVKLLQRVQGADVRFIRKAYKFNH